MSKPGLVIVLIILFSLGAGLFIAWPRSTGFINVGDAQAADHWQIDWALRDDFTIEIDSQGFQLPTAIAFVPDPGDKPGDPLYFVTELFGAVKVVTNDRSVFTFADDV